MNPAAPWKLASISDNKDSRCDLVRQWLREDNWKKNPEVMAKYNQEANDPVPLVLLASVEDAVIGGILAETVFSWLRISIMSVHPDWRSRGLGASLLAAAEQEALARGCHQSYVDTMEYQAPRFYAAHGYAIVGTLRDWDSHGHAKFFLTKQLRA